MHDETIKGKFEPEETGELAKLAPKNGHAGSSPKSQASSTGNPDKENSKTQHNEPLILNPADPLPTARIFLQRFHTLDDIRALQHQSSMFYSYDSASNAYADIDEPAIRAGMYPFLEGAKRWIPGEKPVLVPFQPTKSKVENILDALKAVCNLPTSHTAPCWLKASTLSPLDVIACRNGLLHLPTRRLYPSTPQFFTLNGLNFAFDPKAPEPTNWLHFLSELWPEDPESIATLQEIFGYLLTQRTDYQKMFMIVGPKRSGKGTIGRTLKMLLGDRNVCGPNLANMAEQFGLSILIGKTAAIIADARISGRTDTAVITERLLSISGEDTLSIPRKFLSDWNGKLPTRFLLMTNELPKIEDCSGAVASRFIVLMLTESFYGREDHHLLERFIPELPGILLWAMDGWDRLDERGRFSQPTSSAEMIQEFEDLGSPIGAFLRDCCEVKRGFEVLCDKAFAAWKDWCEQIGRERPGTIQTFGKNLRAAIPWLKVIQPRVLGRQMRYYEGFRLRATDTQ